MFEQKLFGKPAFLVTDHMGNRHLGNMSRMFGRHTIWIFMDDYGEMWWQKQSRMGIHPSRHFAGGGSWHL